jgi:ADP-L-glycero-D-manno-heptose 6-epimerase
MIVITGAAGFIGSSLCRKLNEHGMKNIVLVDDFTPDVKRTNWESLAFSDKIQREDFFLWAEKNVHLIDFIYHLGARTDYFSMDRDIFEILNTDFSQRAWSFATSKRIPFIYASSFLTLGTQPFSFYAKSKYIFDKWVEKQQQTPPLWAGLKFFQVYGAQEAHKAKNASNVYKIYIKYVENAPAIHVKKDIILDYVYINDVVKALYYFLKHAPKNGIYEIGTGFARPLQAIVDAVNKEWKKEKGERKMEKRVCEQKLLLEYQEGEQPHYRIPHTSHLQADLTDLRKYAYKQAFLPLEAGIKRLIRD